ncbi:MAG: ABC transporter ATP-binding protein [Candidatus Thorarchaeota archaeon]|nr:MAG: ABC transporter ATP-binding protein [Candidatus Thorarchaeota archaeon]
MVRVELDGMKRVFKDGTFVGPISLTVEDGELLTMLGPSGSGKTTTLRMIAGFIQPLEGSIRFDGIDVQAVPPRERGIGMVFQSAALFPHMTVYQNIAFGPEMAGWSQSETVERVEELSEILRIQRLLMRRTNEVSGGEAQRVALARALALRPRLLLLDEPLSALDPQLRERLQMEIKEVQKTLGVTTIYVTHSQDEAFAISDRIAVLNEGVVVQIGEPQDLYDSPRSAFVARFLGSGNVFSGVVEESSGNTATVRVGGHLFRVTGSAPVGMEVSFTVKPEDVVLSTEVSVKGIRGRVLGVVPQTGSFRIKLSFEGQDVVVETNDDRLVEELLESTGITVSFSFSETNAHLLNHQV